MDAYEPRVQIAHLKVGGILVFDGWIAELFCLEYLGAAEVIDKLFGHGGTLLFRYVWSARWVQWEGCKIMFAGCSCHCHVELTPFGANRELYVS